MPSRQTRMHNCSGAMQVHGRAWSCIVQPEVPRVEAVIDNRFVIRRKCASASASNTALSQTPIAHDDVVQAIMACRACLAMGSCAWSRRLYGAGRGPGLAAQCKVADPGAEQGPGLDVWVGLHATPL